MEKNIVLICSILTYLLLINFVASIDFRQTTITEYFYSGQGVEVIGVGESVDIQVEKNRFYGKILQGGENSKLYLFWVIPLPLQSYGVGYIKFHIIFLGLISLYWKCELPTNKLMGFSKS